MTILKNRRFRDREFRVNSYFFIFLIAILPGAAVSQICDSRDLAEVLVPSGTTTIELGRAWRVDGGLNEKEISVPAFCMATDEVSVAQYMSCVDAGICAASRDDLGDLTLPVRSITIDDARTFTGWLSKQTGRPYRLPSEAEWQYAALAGSDHPYPWRVWIDLDRPNIFSSGLIATGTGAENPFGIRDMIGNVAEFVDDCFSNNLLGIPADGRASLGGDCEKMFVKGGYFRTADYALSPFFRFGGLPTEFASPQIGFRVTRTLGN